MGIATHQLERQAVQADSPARLNEDFFSTSEPWLLLGITILPFILLLAWLVVAYFGIEYHHPPWNTHSVPPSRIY
jgi:hypothetical protein